MPVLPTLKGVTHRDVNVNGVRLHVAGAGAGPPLLLLHGWPQHWWCWRRVIPSLASEYRIIAPDLRGFGWSQAPSGSYAKSTFASDVVGLLDAEGVDHVRLVGHDWGGYAAFLLALEHPDRVERLLALDIPPPWPSRGLPRPRHLALPLLASYQLALATPGLGARLLTGGPHAVRAMIRGGSGPRASWTDADLDVYANVLRDPARAAASSACYRTFLTRELPAAALRGDRSRDLRVPSLLAMGEHSAIRRVLDPQPGPNLRVQTIRGAGHFLPEEAPDEVTALVRSWMGT
ncbi:MAG: alpha/beta hydrolase [Solirubrobacteraceae bacterium]